MKKKFILLPITLTALAPAISLVGCNKPEVIEYELTENYSYNVGNITIQGLRTKQLLDLEKDITYTAIIDINNFHPANKSHVDMQFYVATDVAITEATSATISTAKVKVNNVPLTKVSTIQELGSMKYCITNSMGKSAVVIGLDTLSATSKVEISFEIEQAVEQYYLVSTIWNI